MKRLGIVVAATIGLAGLAQAADLPTKKEAVPAPTPNCYASFWTWLNSSASDCPLSYYGITLYGTLDVNYGYQEWGAPKSSSADKLQYGIRSNAYEHIWQAGYNGLSTNVLGLKMKEDLAPLGLTGWSFVGVLEAGVNPYTGMFFNGPRSLADVNTTNNSGWSRSTARVSTFRIRRPTSIRAAPASGTTRKVTSASAARPGAP